MFHRGAVIAAAVLLAALSSTLRAAAPILDVVQTLGDGETVVVAERSVDIAIAGSYELIVTDLGVPATLGTVETAVTKGTAVITTLTGAGSKTFDLSAGAYVVRVVGAPDVVARAGNVGLKLRRPADDVTVLEAVAALALPAATLPDNAVLLDTQLTLAAAGEYVVTLADLQLPQPLGTLTLAITPPGGGALAVNLSAAGSATFTGVPGDYRLLAAAQTQTSGQSGIFSVQVRAVTDGAEIFARTLPVGQAQPAGGTPAYQFDVEIAQAGAYRLRVADFEFPGAFAGLHFAAVQNGALLASLDDTGSLELNLAAGHVSLLVIAQPSVADAGLFGLDLTPVAGGAAAFATTQGVGDLFSVHRIDVTAASRYAITLTDAAFPGNFAELAAVVTHGTERLASIFGGGSFQFNAGMGPIFVNFISTPNAGKKAGTYGIRMDVVPADPTPPVDPIPDPTSDKGGGGALDWLALWVLAGATSVSRRLRRERRPPPLY
jgi:hypothetical protein